MERLLRCKAPTPNPGARIQKKEGATRQTTFLAQGFWIPRIHGSSSGKAGNAQYNDGRVEEPNSEVSTVVLVWVPSWPPHENKR